MDYRIDKVKFDVDFSDREAAKDLQDKFFSICRIGLERALEEVLQKYDLPVSITQIALDLGDIPWKDLDQKLINLLVQQFEEALKSHLEELKVHQSSEQFQLEAMILFLEKGLKHWSDQGKMSLLELFGVVLKRSSGALIRFMVNTRHQLTVVSRLIAIIDEQGYAELISKMRPAEATFVLKFIEEVIEVNSIRSFSPTTSGKQLDDSLRQLILLDLIKVYGSAFNRRMFIERNLQALARMFSLSYLELLRHFERILREDVPYRMTGTLPGLIQDISKKYQNEEERKEDRLFDYFLVIGSLISTNKPLHQLLKEDFEATLQEYSGEVRRYLLRHTRTIDQVKSLVTKLTVPQLERLIETVEPAENQYIQTYISSAKGIAHEQIEFRSDQVFHEQIYQIVLSYLLIDRGTRFNQKAFLRYQLSGISRASSVEYAVVLNLLRTSLTLLGTTNLGTGMLSFLDEFLEEEETKVVGERLPLVTEIEEVELVKQYLKFGTLPVHLRSHLQQPIMQSFQQVLTDVKARSTLFEFLKEEKGKVSSSMLDLKQAEFEALIRVILLAHWNLSSAHADRFFEQLRKLEKQVVYPVAYRKVVFDMLMSPSLKIRPTSQLTANTIHATDVPDMLVYQLQEQLSLPKINEHPDFKNSLEFQGRDSSFSKSKKRILLALEDTSEESPAYEREALRRAFRKIQESDFETFTLLDHLTNQEIRHLFVSLEKQHLQKLIEQMSVGKWQVLKKTLLLVMKGGNSRHQEVAYFFADLYEQRHLGIHQIYQWINKQVSVLQLPPDYHQQLLERQKMIRTELDLSGHVSHDTTGLTKENEMLINLLRGHKVEGAPSESVDTLFDQLLRHDPQSLYQQLRSLSFRSEDVKRYIAQLSISGVSQWIKFETGAGYAQFEELSDDVEKLLFVVFKSDRSINVNQQRLLAIRLMLANRVGQYAVSFEQVLKFYMQELAEHSTYKYNLVQKWLFQGLKRGHKEISEWLEPERFAALEEETKPFKSSEQLSEDESLDAIEEISEALSNLKVPNSGLVLIWPFFQRLFAMLDYLNEKNEFKSNVERSRAVRLLHFICGFDWDEPEYNLTLNKILCGMPFSDRMETRLEITQKERDTAAQLLEGVIQNWQHLGSTSVSGLQQSFLQRDGFLEKEDENWKLKVEKKGIDVLIDHMPWSYASVILKWIPEVVYVEWR